MRTLKTKKLTQIGLSLMSIFGAASAFAGVTDGVGTWEGSGTVYSVDGTQLTTYTAEMVAIAIGIHEVKSQITVTMADGTKRKITQSIKDDARGFSIVSDNGNGGGYCMSESLCLSYVSASNQHAFSTTMIIDDSNTERFLTTELENGKALSITSQKYFKVN
jgi:hypothetical protein